MEILCPTCPACPISLRASKAFQFTCPGTRTSTLYTLIRCHRVWLLIMVCIKAGTINPLINQFIDKFHKNDYHCRFANNQTFDFCVCYFTVFTLSIQTPQLLTILCLKFEQVQFTIHCCVKNSWMSGKQCSPWWDDANVAFHLGLHCLLRPVCPNTYKSITYGRVILR